MYVITHRGGCRYASNYLTSGGPLLAPFPMRTGCKHFAGLDDESSSPEQLIAALGRMAGVFNNATGEQQCYELPTDDEDDAMWDYIWCTETLPQETYFAMDGVHDMFCAISRCVLGRSCSDDARR